MTETTLAEAPIGSDNFDRAPSLLMALVPLVNLFKRLASKTLFSMVDVNHDEVSCQRKSQLTQLFETRQNHRNLCEKEDSKMGILRWMEDALDSVFPKVSVSDFTETTFDSFSFDELISELANAPYFTLRSRKRNECVLNVKGNTIGNLEQCKVFFGGKPVPEMYKTMKSRVKISLQQDNRLKVESFEHVASMGEEIEAIKKMLESRLLTFIDRIDSGSLEDFQGA